MNIRAILFTAIIAFITWSLPGCSSNESKTLLSNTPTKYVIVPAEGYELKEELYLKENDPDVKTLNSAVQQFLKLKYTKKYSTMKGDEEYRFMDPKVENHEREQGYLDKMVEFYKKYKLSTSFAETDTEYIHFSPDKNHARVSAHAKFRIDSADASLEKDTGLMVKNRYKVWHIIDWEKIDGEWKIVKTFEKEHYPRKQGYLYYFFDMYSRFKKYPYIRRPDV